MPAARVYAFHAGGDALLDSDDIAASAYPH